MKTLNYKKSFPIDYIKRHHRDFMSEVEASTLQDVDESRQLMKLLVMRIVA